MFQTVAGRLGAGCSFSRLTPWPRSGQHDAPCANFKLLIYIQIFCSTDTFLYRNSVKRYISRISVRLGNMPAPTSAAEQRIAFLFRHISSAAGALQVAHEGATVPAG